MTWPVILQAEEQAYQKALEAAQAQVLAEAAAAAAKARARAERRSASVPSGDSEGGWQPSASAQVLAGPECSINQYDHSTSAGLPLGFSCICSSHSQLWMCFGGGCTAYEGCKTLEMGPSSLLQGYTSGLQSHPPQALMLVSS